MPKIVFCNHCDLALRSRSKVRVKVKGRVKVMSQGQRSTSNFWRAAVDIRGSALPSAAKREGESLPVKSVCLCVCNPWAYAGNRADAVDRLLIFRV